MENSDNTLRCGLLQRYRLEWLLNGIAVGLIDTSYEGHGSSGRMSSCRRSTRRSSRGTWSRSPAGWPERRGGRDRFL